MRSHRIVTSTMIVALLLSAIATASVSAAPLQQGGGTRQIPSAGTTSIRSGATGVDGIQQPELRPGADEEEGAGSVNRPRPGFKNGKFPKKPLDAPTVPSSTVAGSNPELALSINGLNHRNQRLANGGNQFSLEPPDQGLCVGNGYVLEVVNDVLRVFDTAGNPLTGVVDLNTFYGYAAQFNRTTFLQGPFVTDPSCYYDPGVQRWFQVVLTLDVVPESGDFTGKNHIDLAVSQTADPTGAWTIYR
jgi:hypothetical protein